MSEILLIEDDDSQREALEEFLRDSLGKKVNSASSISEALTLFQKKTPEIIVSDLMLPDGTGIDFIKEVRKSDETIPILILTAQPSIETAVEAIHSGASDI